MTPIWVLIGVNILFFLATSVAQEFLFFFGLIPPSAMTRPWALITSLFVHGNIWHILTNMITLYFVGRYAYKLFGAIIFFVVYFVGGITGNILYIFLAPPLSIAFGSSGGIIAVLGTLAMMKPTQRVYLFTRRIPLPLWIVVVVVVLIISLFPNVAWQAHLGGLVFGAVMGLCFKKKRLPVLI